MYAYAEMHDRDDSPREDHVVHLRGVSWADYERLLAIRGERPVPRLAYFEGTLEIMSPSRDHESIKSFIGRLVEAWCMEKGVVFSPYGAWTLKEEERKSGAEPDECYVFGDQSVDRPHLAIEVIWTSGRLDKLQIYRRLGVQEVWVWEKGRLTAYGLHADGYRPLAHSAVLPGIDLDQLVSFLDRPTAFDAIRDFRRAIA